ncbi:MAG: AAA family ATPase [Elusimicrobia bacterium]|nr:AAA family ATPase [Elusimicrobiota bacterium]
MANGRSPAEAVSAWFKAQEDTPAKEVIERFARTWDALWRRAEATLGDITVKSASQRVLAGAAERYPALAPLRVDDWEASFDCLLADGDGRLREALAFLLSETLGLLGHLSGGILTPALHSLLTGEAGDGSAPVAVDVKKSALSAEASLPRLSTGVRNLDEVLGGGLPEGSVTVIAGAPGSGKTTLGHQIAFHHAAPDRRVLYMSTFSEPAAKLMKFMRQFAYFDAGKIDDSIHLMDIGKLLRDQNLERHLEAILAAVESLRPSLLVIDSFKGFEGLAHSPRQFRRFCYDLAASLVAWDCTTLLIGEYIPDEESASPLFSVVDGLLMLSHYETAGEEQRFIQVLKMRGTDHSPDRQPFSITARGIEVYAPSVAIRRTPRPGVARERIKLGVSRLDELLDGGILRGSSVLVSGVSGTGKTVLLLEILYRGALKGEKGLLFSFEETPERLRETAIGLGWDFDRQIEEGRLELAYIPQPDIRGERHLLMMHERIQAFEPARVAVDSLSVFLHKISDPTRAREKTFQLAAAIDEADAVGFLSTDIPYGTPNISRMGVEETVLDGAIILSSESEGLERRRYVEVYKLRATPHLLGRHAMAIDQGGVRVFPRASIDVRFEVPPEPRLGRRLGTGVPGLDALLGGGVFEHSATIVSGSAGSGKSTIALQFIAEGAAAGEKGLYVTLEEGPGQILATADALGLAIREPAANGFVELLYFPPERIAAGQYLTVLTEKIQAAGVRRLVFDGASRLATAGLGREQAQILLHNLVVRFKALGVTSLLTLESQRLHSTDVAAEGGVSAVADNLIMLRYSHGGARTPLLTVVKTRASAHSAEAHTLTVGKGGARVGPARRAMGAVELPLP